jgi:bacillithiol synthase
MVRSHTEIGGRSEEVLRAYDGDRSALCRALVEINRGLGAEAPALENIELLCSADTVAVVTGQQTGLFGGPLYTIYKAISAIKMAECLRGRGIAAVPVFWMATEDHDLDEVSQAGFVASDNSVASVSLDLDVDGQPSVGSVTGGAAFETATDEMFGRLRETAFSGEARSLVRAAWNSSETFGTAFGKMVSRIFAQRGLVMLDPRHVALRRLASRTYIEAIDRAEKIADALVKRGSELEAAGYHAQVVAADDHFPLFWIDDDGSRRALRRGPKGTLHAQGSRRTFAADELRDVAARTPERLSPGALLRPVVQDRILPTICYFGGAAEIAYYAQNSEVYRVLDRPVTPILHRQSFTVVSPPDRRTIDKYSLGLEDLFAGRDALYSRLVSEQIDPGTARMFAAAEEGINTELHRLDSVLGLMDPTLAAALATRRRKIIYHIGAVRKKFARRRIEIDDTIRRRLDSLFANLWPRQQLQERVICVAALLDRFGQAGIDAIYEAADLDDRGHRVLYF